MRRTHLVARFWPAAVVPGLSLERCSFAVLPVTDLVALPLAQLHHPVRTPAREPSLLPELGAMLDQPLTRRKSIGPSQQLATGFGPPPVPKNPLSEAPVRPIDTKSPAEVLRSNLAVIR